MSLWAVHGRSVDSIPHRLHSRCTQPSLPNGWPHSTLRRRPSSSNLVSARFTRAIQPRGRSTGQSLSQDLSFGRNKGVFSR